MRPVLALLLALLVYPACSREVAKPEFVTLGVALGRSNHPGILMAVEEVNRGGGIGGVALRAHGLDWNDQGFAAPARTIAWADELSARSDVLAVIGHSDSSATLAAASLYNDRGIPHLVTIATHPGVTRIGPWTFRLCIDDAQQGMILAHHAVVRSGRRRIAVFYVNDDYGRGLAEHFQYEAVAAGAEIVDHVFHANELTSADEHLLAGIVQRWQSGEPPDLLVLLNRPGAARRILRLVRDAGLDVPVLGADNLSLMIGYREDLPLIEEAQLLAMFLPDLGTARTDRLISELRTRFERPPAYDVALAYDAVMLAAAAIERGGYRRAGVRTALERMIAERAEIDGVAGPYVLGPDRNPTRPVHVIEVRGGRTHRVASYRRNESGAGVVPFEPRVARPAPPER